LFKPLLRPFGDALYGWGKSVQPGTKNGSNLSPSRRCNALTDRAYLFSPNGRYSRVLDVTLRQAI
jgi:hypothetical protein